MSGVRRLSSAAELLEATGAHPVVVLDIGDGFVPPAYAVGPACDGPSGGFPGGAAVAVHRRSDHGVPGTAALGTASGLAALLADREVRSWVTCGGNRHLSVSRGTTDVVAARLDLGARGGDWDWLWTSAEPPAVAGEDAVVELHGGDRDEVVRFLDEHSPRTHGQPFARPGQRWVGVREAGDGPLVAVGGSEPSQAGIPALAGIAVGTGRRGEGWGAAVTAHLTRLAVREAGACTLGMFADNDIAQRLYHRLGFTTGMEWTSRWFGS